MFDILIDRVKRMFGTYTSLLTVVKSNFNRTANINNSTETRNQMNYKYIPHYC